MTGRAPTGRSLLLDALADAVPSWIEADGSARRTDVRRPHRGPADGLARGRVCLAAVEAFGDDRIEVESAVPAAVAVELAAGHVAVHRRTSLRLGDSDAESDPTRAILRGDALLSVAFERLTALDVPASTRNSCLSALTDGCRRTQEARGILADASFDSDGSELVQRLDSRLGALVGCAGSIAGLLAGVDDDRVDELERTATRFGSELGFARLREASILDASTVGTPAAIDRHLDAVLDCLPEPCRADARSALADLTRPGTHRSPEA
ncbi:hypothetical protein [Halovivax limisalsi]|uniref:hypothetical protein n=1 Tax=Halovivax limisalsi TaxID=1453760 RepID=UPI001FFDD7A5|nr:hypothetical protein [Halovivax limisalsi]